MSFNLSHAFQIRNTLIIGYADLEEANKVQRDKPKRQGCQKKEEAEAHVWVCEATLITFHKSVDL